MRKTPKGFRLHIGLFGRRNVGKSSLLNAMTRQNVSIVSDVAGTTTDPVEKPMELLPVGPVLFIDTAGIDDDFFWEVADLDGTNGVTGSVYATETPGVSWNADSASELAVQLIGNVVPVELQSFSIE